MLHDAIAEMKAVAAGPRQAAFVGDVAREIGGIDLGLKTDEIVVAQRRNELVVVRQRGDDFRRRKRNMDEKSDLIGMTAIAQRLGERHQMIVVHPHNVVGSEQRLQMPGEEFVDAEVAAEIAAREFGEVEPVMQNRPQHPVGEAVVEFLVVVLAQIDGGVSDVVVLDDPGRARIVIRRTPAPAEPKAATPPQRRPDRDFEPAGARVAIGNANSVRDYDEPRQYRSPQLRDSLIAVNINPDIE